MQDGDQLGLPMVVEEPKVPQAPLVEVKPPSTGYQDPKLERLLADAPWHRSKTDGKYANIPHEYIMPHWYRGWKIIQKAMNAALSSSFTYERRFGNRIFRYIDIAGYRYWGMHEIVVPDVGKRVAAIDDIINREALLETVLAMTKKTDQDYWEPVLRKAKVVRK